MRRKKWFEEHNNELEVLNWPPRSSDKNPIEHMWDFLDKQVQTHNLQDLKDHTFTFRGPWVRGVLAEKRQVLRRDLCIFQFVALYLYFQISLK